MDSINTRMGELSKKSKNINLKSTSLINQINQQNKPMNYQTNNKQSSYNIDMERQQQQGIEIAQQPTPYNPYTFNRLSLISSLIPQSKIQSIQQSIQEKKQRYNQRFKCKQINRQNFLNKMTQSLQKINMITSIQIKDNNNDDGNSQQIDQDDQNVSLTLSGDKPTTLRKPIQQENLNSYQKDLNGYQKNLNSYQKDLNSQLKMSIHQSNYENQQLSQYNSKYQSIQKAQKQRKKVIIKRSNKQSLQTSQRFDKQSSSNHKRINNKISNNKQFDQNQRKDNFTQSMLGSRNGQTLLRSKNEFMFLQQYQRDQKQMMNRLLNIIESQMYNKKVTNQSHYKSAFINQHINESKQINKNQSLKSSHYRNNQFSSVKKSTYNNNQPQYSLMMDQDLVKKQKNIRQLQEYRKMRNKKTLITKNQQENKNILSQTVKINLKKNQNLINKEKQQLSSLNQSKQIQDKNGKKYNKANKKQQTKNFNLREDDSELNSNQQQQSDMESINFQHLYQRLKQQQINNASKNNKNNNKKQFISQIVSLSPQFSSINPSHQTSINQMLFSQTSTKKSIQNHQSQQKQKQKQDNIKFHSQQLKKQTNHPQINFQNTSSNINNTSFNINNTSSNIQNKSIHQNQSPQNSSNKPFTIQEKKQSVLIQIPFDDNQNPFNNNISLADAFKKKFGANKLQKKNKQKQQPQKINHQSTQPLSQLKHNNHQTKKDLSSIPHLTLQQSSIKNDFDKTLTKQNKSRPIKFNQKNKQNINSLQTPRTHSQKGRQTDRSLKTNSVKQPPKQLIDRLIYGKKINMSKKDMYQLSKKNYMKLPEIEERRKQQEKKQKQIQRLQKIKQYQKRIRSNKHSLSKDSMKTSIDVDINE